MRHPDTNQFPDVFSDALLSAHEAEISRLEALKEQRTPTLQMIAKHRSLIKDREDLAASSQDASRLMARGNKGEKRDPTRLLREEKMRKRIAKDLPKLEQELCNVLETWEEEYGRPFLVFGERYMDVMTAAPVRAPPPRSKTPNGLPLPQIRPGINFAASVQRGTGTHEPLIPRLKTPIETGTLTRNHFASSRSAASTISPSRIPSRIPLGPAGGNSPERLGQQGMASGTVRKLAPSSMAPPPKMRNLFIPPPAATPSTNHNSTDILRSGSVVRNIPPEDPYGDHLHRSYLQSSLSQTHQRPLPHPQAYRDMPPPPRPTYPQNHDQHNQGRPDTASTASTSRHISGTSSTTTANTGSENWEAYGDDDDDGVAEPESDVSAAYHARLRAAKEKGKRVAPDEEGGKYGGMEYGSVVRQGKKLKGTVVEVDGEGVWHRLVEGSDAGWTDEDCY